jgi:hypothetical protein
MKQILGLILLIVSIAFSADIYTSGGPVHNFPVDVQVVTLHSKNTPVAMDTFAASQYNWYGPYELAGDNCPMYKSFTVKADTITGTTPTMAFWYQLISGGSITDTVKGAWVSPCTLSTSGVSSSVDLSSLCGRAIVFRIFNYDNTSCQIPGNLKILFKRSISFIRESME